MSNNVAILLVDDEPNNLRALALDLEDTGYRLVFASDGQDAWEVMEKEEGRFSAILLDRMMPRMDGMEFMKKLKAHPKWGRIPVVMQTAAAGKEQVVQGIQAGVYYYLTKPYDKLVMLSVLQAAVRDYGNYSGLRNKIQNYESKLHLVRSSRLEVKTLEDTIDLATFLAQFFPAPERVVFGISELLTNALEHGNLGITYDEKTELNQNNAWLDEIERRQKLPENQNKIVVIEFTKTNECVQLTIRDQGKGFNWQNYLDISPERATHNHGRGIAMARIMSFDEIHYVGAGNEVVCKVRLE